MVVWKNLIKGFIKALTPIVIIPACAICWILQMFGLTLSSILLIVMVAQLYLVWSQVEAALWHARLSALSYEPVLVAR